MKQYLRVFESIKAGAETSFEAAGDCGLSIAAASACLSELERLGLVQRAGIFFKADAKRSFVRWRPAHAAPSTSWMI